MMEHTYEITNLVPEGQGFRVFYMIDGRPDYNRIFPIDTTLEEINTTLESEVAVIANREEKVAALKAALNL